MKHKHQKPATGALTLTIDGLWIPSSCARLLLLWQLIAYNDGWNPSPGDMWLADCKLWSQNDITLFHLIFIFVTMMYVRWTLSARNTLTTCLLLQRPAICSLGPNEYEHDTTQIGSEEGESG